MSYGTGVMRIPILLLFCSMFLGKNAEVCYEPKITDSVFSCDDFKNEVLNCDELKLGSSKGDDGDDTAKLGGKIKTLQELGEGYDLEIDVWKMMDLADEFMYSARVPLCDSLKNEDAPWYPVIQQMNITECPVPINVFEVQGITINLDSMKDVMCHEFCGEYRVHMAFMDADTMMSCHIIEMCIVEKNDE